MSGICIHNLTKSRYYNLFLTFGPARKRGFLRFGWGHSAIREVSWGRGRPDGVNSMLSSSPGAPEARRGSSPTRETTAHPARRTRKHHRERRAVAVENLRNAACYVGLLEAASPTVRRRAAA